MKKVVEVSPQLLHDLLAAVEDLKNVNPWHGLLRFMLLGGASLGLAVLTWQMQQMGWFVLGAIATSVVYTFWIVCNHDAIHRTLTGWRWFDKLMPRLSAWPLLIPVSTYSCLHRLHHAQNGIDLHDPERVQRTVADYQRSSSWQRWYVRHQWMIDVFVFGSIGIIVKIALQGFRLKNTVAGLRQQMVIDAVGMVSVQTTIVSLLYLNSINLWRYLLFMVILERGVGIIMQARDHIEHYGLEPVASELEALWQPTSCYTLRQLYACRNVRSPAWVNWLMGGLPYHSVHHAFPGMVSTHLPEAFQRIQAVLERHHLPPMILEPGYIASSFRLGTQRYRLIEPV